MARALLNSANHLTSHQEQTEWLSGQCEVWRSKFLASSLMVEELARWKSALTQRLHEFQESTKCLLEERNKACNALIKTQQRMVDILEHLGNKVLAETDGFLAVTERNQELIESIANILHVESTKKEVSSTLKPSIAEKSIYQVITKSECDDFIILLLLCFILVTT